MNVYHFIGLGGIGMSALARISMQRGDIVQGSDQMIGPLLEELRQEGATIQEGQVGEGLEKASAVIYSSDIKEGNAELARARELGVPVFHRSEFLDLLMQGARPLLVTGTHGKTTTTALLISVIGEAGLDPSFALGGIHKSWHLNGRAGLGPYFVAEADESDGSFLRTKAFSAIVTNLEDDHLDYWKESAFLDEAFKVFIDQTERVFWCGDDERLQKIAKKGISYGFNPSNELCIRSFQATETGVLFDLSWRGKNYPHIELRLFGRHNALNGAAVFGLALHLGIDESVIRAAFCRFSGIHRRLELKGLSNGLEVYDDYGHHPTEIKVTLQALRDKIREKRLLVLFQPHRYSRVRDLFEDFVTSFDEADCVVMTDIYAAGEQPIPGVTSAALYAKMRERLGSKLSFFPRAHLESGALELLKPHDVVLTIGAGDITKAGPPILERYRERAPKWKVAVLFGGTSSEHAVSLMSARTIIDALDSSLYEVKYFGLTKEGEWLTGPDALEKLEQKIVFADKTAKLSPLVLQELSHSDVAIPVFHGQQGEDGMIQGLLESLQIAYVGCDYRSSAICMQKAWTKQIACMAGIPTARYIEIDRHAFHKNPDLAWQKMEEQLTYPLWIKPVHLGSSIGVARVETREEAEKAVKIAFALDDILIAECEIAGREIEICLLGNETIRTAEPAEIVKLGAFHSYDTKYGAGASEIIVANLSPSQRKTVEAYAKTMYRAAGCKGLSRIDFFLDRAGYFWFNEINPMPGFTKTSAYPQLWNASGLPIAKLCDELLILALHSQRRLREIRGH